MDQEVYHGNDVRGEEERPYAPTMAPIDPKTASGTINGVYISSPIQHNNILRSHHLFFKASNDDYNDEDNAQYGHDFLGVYESLKSL